MALTIVALTVTKVIQYIRIAFREKLDASLLKIQELLGTGIAASSEVKISNLESKIDQLKNEIKELKSKNLCIQGVKKIVDETVEVGHANQLTINSNILDADNKDLEFLKDGHALANFLILDNILRNLKFPDIQSFRLVCRGWKDASDTVFWKRSKITVKNSAGFLNASLSDWSSTAIRTVEEDNNKLVRRFENTFSSPGLPSNAIEFAGFINRSILDYFLKDCGSMTLENIYFQAFREPSNLCIDLNNYLTENVTTLIIKNAYYCSNFKVSLEALANIKNLELADCEILLNGKITPRRLKLYRSCSVKYEGNVYELTDNYGNSQRKILINDFVDFSKTNDLHLCGNILRLDASIGTAELVTFDIESVELIGLSKSRWTTKSYVFQKNICVGTKMEIKAIDHTSKDPRTLPTEIEYLAIWYHHNIATPHNFMYPKLKYCCLKNSVLFLCPLLDFTNCTSLIDFAILENEGIYQMDFNRIVLPASVKRMHLRNVDVTIDALWQLDVLYLDDYSMSFAKSVLRHISTIKLKLQFKTAVVLEEDKTTILNFWNRSNIQQFAVGPIYRSNKNGFLNSEFSKAVDKIGSHFLFTKKMNGKGKAIDSDTFKRLTSIGKNIDLYWPLE